MGLTVLTVRRGGGFLYRDKLLLSQRDPPPSPPLLWVGSSAHAAAPVGPARGHRDPAVKAGLPRASASCHLQQTVDGHSRFRHKPLGEKAFIFSIFYCICDSIKLLQNLPVGMKRPRPCSGQ